MIWSVVPVGGERECGGCGRLLLADQPLALLTARQLPRCASCAGAPVDDQAVDQARLELERAREALAALPVSAMRPVYRHRIVAPPRPAAAIPGDLFTGGKDAAVGREEDV